jgi:hypothetical protein
MNFGISQNSSLSNYYQPQISELLPHNFQPARLSINTALATDRARRNLSRTGNQQIHHSEFQYCQFHILFPDKKLALTPVQKNKLSFFVLI